MARLIPSSSPRRSSSMVSIDSGRSIRIIFPDHSCSAGTHLAGEMADYQHRNFRDIQFKTLFLHTEAPLLQNGYLPSTLNIPMMSFRKLSPFTINMFTHSRLGTRHSCCLSKPYFQGLGSLQYYHYHQSTPSVVYPYKIWQSASPQPRFGCKQTDISVHALVEPTQVLPDLQQNILPPPLVDPDPSRLAPRCSGLKSPKPAWLIEDDNWS